MIEADAVWIGGLLVGAIGGALVAIANVIQTKVAGRQAIILAAQVAKDATDRQLADWKRQDLVAARLDKSDRISTDQFNQLLRLGTETKGLVNHRLTVALQKLLLALQGTLAVLSDKPNPSETIKQRIVELKTEIAGLQEELALRDLQQSELDEKHDRSEPEPISR
jgi:hypothetical protein